MQVQDKSFDVDFAFGPDRSTEEVFDSLIVQQGVRLLPPSFNM